MAPPSMEVLCSPSIFCAGDLSDVTEEQLGYLKEWEDKFNEKYPVVSLCINLLSNSPFANNTNLLI